MQIVIDMLPEEYEAICKVDSVVNVIPFRIAQAIKEGTVLPENHGRLGDLDELEHEITNGINAGNYEEGYEEYPHINDMDDCVDAVRYAPTIIEGTEGKE